MFGVKIGIEAEKIRYLKKLYRLLEKTFPSGFEKVREQEIEFRFTIKLSKTEKSERFELFRIDEKLIEDTGGELFFQMVESEVRVTVAEFAVSRVFLHAGVVAWKNEALVIPAKSYSCKSTLVAEFIKKGVVHYSDEYAVLDAAGNVQPFPKWLSLRGIIDPYTQLECSVESIGGIAGAKTISVGIVCTVGLACEYLGLKVEDTPIVDEVKNIPRWLIKTIEKEWKSDLKLVPLHHFLHDKKSYFGK